MRNFTVCACAVSNVAGTVSGMLMNLVGSFLTRSFWGKFMRRRQNLARTSSVEPLEVRALLTSLSVGDISIAEGQAGTSSLRFTVELDSDTDEAFTVRARTIDGSATSESGDYVPTDLLLAFSGSAGESRTVTVPVNGDVVVEPNETFFLQLLNASSDTVDLPTAPAVAQIIDEDANSSIRLEAGTFFVQGTLNDDTIRVERFTDVVRVVFNNQFFSAPTPLTDAVEINASNGDDFVFAEDGFPLPMVVRGGNGNDTVKTGTGDDFISGGNGDDSLRGTRGDDTIEGGVGNDTLEGQLGNDLINGGIDDDSITGNDGDDTLFGSSGNDNIRGDDGNDVIRAGSGDDVVFGGSDADQLFGDVGADRLDGGLGNDRVVGEDGNDTLLGGAGSDTLVSGGGNDSLVGGSGNDTLGAGSGADTLIGGSGEDRLNAGNGPDILFGGAQNDVLLGRAGDDVIVGGSGNDTLQGLTGRDILYGGTGRDLLEGNGNEDLLIAGLLTPASGLSTLEHLSGSLRDEWRSGRSLEQRVANVLDLPGGTNNRQNNVFLIEPGRSGSNLESDRSSPDTLSGGAKLDVYFADIGLDTVFGIDDFGVFDL